MGDMKYQQTIEEFLRGRGGRASREEVLALFPNRKSAQTIIGQLARKGSLVGKNGFLSLPSSPGIEAQAPSPNGGTGNGDILIAYHARRPTTLPDLARRVRFSAEMSYSIEISGTVKRFGSAPSVGAQVSWQAIPPGNFKLHIAVGDFTPEPGTEPLGPGFLVLVTEEEPGGVYETYYMPPKGCQFYISWKEE